MRKEQDEGQPGRRRSGQKTKESLKGGDAEKEKAAADAMARVLDVQGMIQKLLTEKRRLDMVIASLEALEKTPADIPETGEEPKRRGRRPMTQEERLEVSRRMRQYWDMRRQSRQQP